MPFEGAISFSLYAAGEILLVVIGILLSLQIKKLESSVSTKK